MQKMRREAIIGASISRMPPAVTRGALLGVADAAGWWWCARASLALLLHASRARPRWTLRTWLLLLVAGWGARHWSARGCQGALPAQGVLALPQQPSRGAYPRRLCIGPSGVCLVYQMGVWSSFLENPRVRDMLGSTQILGISGGAAVAGYVYASLHGVQDMGVWYRTAVRTIAHPDRRITHVSSVIWGLSFAYYSICESRGLGFGNGQYGVVLTRAAGCQPVVCDRFLTAHQFADAASASSFVPLLFGALFYDHPDGWMMDGVVGARLSGMRYMPLECMLDAPLSFAQNLRLQLACLRDPVAMDELYQRGRRWGRQHPDPEAFLLSHAVQN